MSGCQAVSGRGRQRRSEPAVVGQFAFKVGRDSVAVEEFPATEWRATFKLTHYRIGTRLDRIPRRTYRSEGRAVPWSLPYPSSCGPLPCIPALRPSAS